jgi:hypothetical protein
MVFLKLTKEEVKNITNKISEHYDKSELDSIARSLLISRKISFRMSKRIDFEDLAMIYRCSNFDFNKMISLIKKYKSVGKTTEAQFKSKFLKIFKHYIKLDEVLNRIKKSSVEKSKKSSVEKSVDKTKDLIKFFGIRPQALEDKLRAISMGEDISREEVLKEYIELRQLFIASAKGELTTQVVNVLYEITDVDENGNPTKKKIFENTSGKKIINVQYKTTLPDAKALIGVKIMDELIAEASISSKNILDDEELEKLYDSIVMDANEQREKMIHRAITKDLS